MAEEPPSETLDSPPSDRSADQSPTSVSSHSSTADPSLSRSVSFSRLNAKAPEFVPTRPIPARADLQQQPRLVIPQGPPPPPPSGVVHMFPTSPFHHVPIQSHVPAQNHHQHHHHRVQYHPHHQQHQYYGSGFGEQEAMHAQQAAGEPADHAAASRNGLPEEATQKILNQVEYYFSDVNLATTDHLMRFINKDPEGYVPISVVASFKKIKALISSQSQLATILRNSTKLVISEDGKKVKRRHPLTELDMEELQSRIVIAENLPEDHCHQNLMKVFSAVGSVKTIRTCQPQPSNTNASSASRSAKAEGMFFSNKLHAFVEYESIELAEKAVAELNEVGNWRSGLKVRLLLRRTSKSGHTRGKKGQHENEGNCEEDGVSTSELNEKQLEDSSQQSDIHSYEYTGEEHVNVNVSEKEGGQRKGRNRGRGKGRGRVHHHNHRGNHHMGTPPKNEQLLPIISKQPPGPRMPDGTRGFAMGRGKPLAVNNA